MEGASRPFAPSEAHKKTLHLVMIKERNKSMNQPADFRPGVRSGFKALSAHKTTIGALALLLWAAQLSAASFTFSTGDPDGKIATLSRVPGLDKIQTETADDFVVTQAVVISQATFTGLLPVGTSPNSVGNVEVEFYHVFPGDSNTNRTINVPTRANSPGDVEIDDATRDGSDGSLGFAVMVVNPSFTASNSVVNGIIPGTAPSAPFTGGEGPVTGEAVTIVVSFNPPVALPAGHYFFRPEVDAGSADFLWLPGP